MYRLAIVGGRLQGVEAAYLGLKAGMHVTVIDRDPQAPARELCHRFHCLDVCRPGQELRNALTDAHGVLPALENLVVLETLKDLTRAWDLNTLFDWEAFMRTSSKKRSNEIFEGCGIPVPLKYPAGKAPYIAKPVSESGSRGVRLFRDAGQAKDFLAAAADPTQWILEEYLPGRAYSIEVIGAPGNYRTYAVTEIIVDERYDCCQVLAPCLHLTEGEKNRFSGFAVILAEKLQLKGIMDVEAIEDNGVLKVLEMDARLPSQTPTAVYHSTGINLLSELVQVYQPGQFPGSRQKENTCQSRWVSYEHLVVSGDSLLCQGEHVMSNAGPLRQLSGFCGADEALTNYRAGSDHWVGTFINRADSGEILAMKREAMMEGIRDLQKEVKR